MLKQDVLIEVHGAEKVLRHFPIEKLSKEAAHRFAQLFAVRPKWLMPDLEPFLMGLQVLDYTLLIFCVWITTYRQIHIVCCLCEAKAEPTCLAETSSCRSVPVGHA